MALAGRRASPLVSVRQTVPSFGATATEPPVSTPPRPDKDDIALALGRAVIAWNMAENAVRGLLASLAAGRPHEAIAARILTSDLDAEGIVTGLKTFAQLSFVADAADAVVHV